MRKSRAAIAQLNVLRSCDTEPEKSEEYKKCINDILPDIDVLDIIFDRIVNISLIKSLKMVDDYNSMVSSDPNRHLTAYEFRQVKDSLNAHLTVNN